MRIITIALLTTLATLAPANAQDVRFHDAQGRVTGSARTDANGVTTFHDRSGRVTGTARTDRNGVTTFRDHADARLRVDAQGRDGGVREKLPAQVVRRKSLGHRGSRWGAAAAHWLLARM
jgi:hypothetical protein